MTKSSIPYSRLEDGDIVHVSSSNNRLRRPVAVFFIVGIAVIIISIAAIVLLAAFLLILSEDPVSSTPNHKSSVPGTSVPSDHVDLLRLLHRLRSLEREVASLRSQCQRCGSALQESEANQQLLNEKTNRHHQSTVSPSSDGNVIDDSKSAATNVKYTEDASTTLPKSLSTDTNDVTPLNPGLSSPSLSHRQARSKESRKASRHEQTDSHGELVRNPGDRERSDRDRSDRDRSDRDRSGRDRTDRDRDLSDRDRSGRDRSGRDRSNKDGSNPDCSNPDCSNPDCSNRDEQQSGTRREETTRNRPSRNLPVRGRRRSETPSTHSNRQRETCRHCIDNDKTNTEGEQAGVGDTFKAPPALGRAVHIQGKRNGNIRIGGDGWVRGFQWWEKADWTSDTDQDFDLNVFGTVTVTESGLYYVYSQVLFYDSNDTVGQSITINGEPYFTCTKSNISAEAKQSTCYIGGVVRINAGDSVGIKLSVRNITIAFHADTTYFGLFRVA